ncbi:MAG: glycosyltransferase family 1 protein [Chloroflexi bacterium]|nr:glycosyltransferase family 1 protein [Chloroflexota bacterium]
MRLLGTIAVQPVLPKPIERLNELAYNLWWTWSPQAHALFERIDPDLWEETNHNPVKLLHSVAPEQLDALARNRSFLDDLEQVCAAFDAYMNHKETWYHRHCAQAETELIAYFSAEFGLHESLPIYSGGLGILSGDHCKSASDLGLPFVGVGFLYPQGYFTQRIGEDGEQYASYEKLDFTDLPAVPATDPNGDEVLISVQLPGRDVFARVWQLRIGRVSLYLLDTDVEKNAPADRELSARLYGGDMELRIAQEVVLGIGGVRALRAIGLKPTVWHMNEGHAAFLSLERVRELVQEHRLSFFQAQQVVASSSVFTTHTPVPAGNDAFPFDMIERFFRSYWGQMGLDREGFMNLARWRTPWGERFSMTVLAIRFAHFVNGVSALHGHVARKMWRGLWPDTPVEEVPITHVTNGVHTDTWLAPELAELYDLYFHGEWREEPDSPDPWQGVADIPDKELWDAHQQLRRKALDFLRERVARQRRRHGESPAVVAAAYDLLDPNALTIGFARRFATYKRATLIFRDLERIRRILSHPERPVQIIFSGKAHPADEPGKALIKQVHQLSNTPEFEGRIIFIEDYDMNIARHLVQGVDVWLNNPRRPNEASGTSGQKAALNGIPNLSVLDGWWDEGYNGKNGWAIGEDREYKSEEVQDDADAAALYYLLENEVIPAFFERNELGLPPRWLAIMKESIRSCGPAFSMSRQVKDYVNRLYLPAAAAGKRMTAQEFAAARELAAWKERVYMHWHQVRLSAERARQEHVQVGATIELEARLYPGPLSADELQVEIAWGWRENDEIHGIRVVEMKADGVQPDGGIRYKGALTFDRNGRFGYGVRVLPRHPLLTHKFEMALVKWAS